MQFINHTPFPALAFGGVDQQRQPFHVVVLRQTLNWDVTGLCHLADEQAPLCEADEFFAQDLQGSVRQESDLCQYKPRCDVIVNATAHAPLQAHVKRASRFEVRLVVSRPDTPAPLPRAPQGMNQFSHADAKDVARWQAAVAHAKQNPIAGARLIDKTLTVTGERFIVKRNLALRAVGGLLKVATLGLVRLPAWRLTPPRSAASLALRLEQAFGGQSRIEKSDRAAARVAKKQRLTAAQAEAHPAAAAPPMAHAAFDANPAGSGFVADWYLRATGLDRIAAPRVTYPDRRFTLKDFDLCRAGQLKANDRLVAGLGVRPKGHPERAKRVGTVDQRFIAGDAALPADFDFGVWNAAWPDQQADEMLGDEVMEMHNLCAHDAPAAVKDARGGTRLRLTLPGHLPFVLVRFESGGIGELRARLDTVVVEPELQRVSLVWRATLAEQPAVRVLEARMLSKVQRDVEATRG